MSKTSLKTTAEWREINWQKLERFTYKLQKRIYQASHRGDVQAVRRLQQTLMKSWSARALAERTSYPGQPWKKDGRCGRAEKLDPKATSRPNRGTRTGF